MRDHCTQREQSPSPVTEMSRPIGNWGRWGPADERGAANLAGPTQAMAAAGLVRRGAVYPLGAEVSARRALGHPARPGPQHLMTVDGGDYAAGLRLPGDLQYAEDVLIAPLHGTTHVDALAHLWSDGSLYNGHPAHYVRSSGARRCGIENLGALVCRGVLLDLAADMGTGHLDGEHVVTETELRACVQRQGIELRPGDCILLRTGWPAMFDRDRTAYHRSSPGIGAAAARYLATQDPCAIGSDTIAVEVCHGDGTYDGGEAAPVAHPILLRDHGIYMIEMLSLDRLAADGVHEFMFVLAPLMITGGTASPVNPVAIA